MAQQPWTLHSRQKVSFCFSESKKKVFEVIIFLFVWFSIVTENIQLSLIASGACFISLIVIGICASICCCIRSKRTKRQLPPADIIPKVNFYFHFLLRLFFSFFIWRTFNHSTSNLYFIFRVILFT